MSGRNEFARLRLLEFEERILGPGDELDGAPLSCICERPIRIGATDYVFFCWAVYSYDFCNGRSVQ